MCGNVTYKGALHVAHVAQQYACPYSGCLPYYVQHELRSDFVHQDDQPHGIRDAYHYPLVSIGSQLDKSSTAANNRARLHWAFIVSFLHVLEAAVQEKWKFTALIPQ